SSSPSSRTRTRRSARSSKRRSRSSRRTSWSGASRGSRSARTRRRSPLPSKISRAGSPSRSRPHPETTTQPPPPEAPAFKRILLKLSGEALLGEKTFGIDRDFTDYIAREIKDAHSLGIEVAAVVGGGNIFLGVSDSAVGMDRVSADHMGMLATVINGLAL